MNKAYVNKILTKKYNFYKPKVKFRFREQFKLRDL